MDQNTMENYVSQFMEIIKRLSNGMTNRVITNKEIGAHFSTLSKEDIFTELSYLEQEGYIEPREQYAFLNKNLIKTFVLTQKGLTV